jgi:transposase
MLCEQLQYDLLFRWFVGLSMDGSVWVPTTFTRNRDRLLRGDIANRFFAAVVEEARRRRWTSDEHFTVAATLLEAWASNRPRGVRSSATHDRSSASYLPPADAAGSRQDA